MRRIPSTTAKNNKSWTAFEYSLVALCLIAMMSLVVWVRKTQVVVTAISPSAILPVEGQRSGGNPTQGYNVAVSRTVIELQQFRQTSSIHIRSAEGREGLETLINLNPSINAWYVLTITWNGSPEVSYHLENPAQLSRKVVLDETFPSGIVIEEGQTRYLCSLFTGTSTNVLDQAARSQNIFAPLCEARLYLRNPAKGRRTTLEGATEFLRNQVWGGERIIVLFHHLMKDTHRETAKIQTGDPTAAGKSMAGNTGNLPLPALIDSQFADQVIALGSLGIAVDEEKGGLHPGSWYAASGNTGIYVSLLVPNLIDPLILTSYKTRVNGLDRTEASSLCYLIAFDLDQFDLSYVRGTKHPAVGWSRHMMSQMRDPKLPGPDGIGSIAPLISTGLINPEDARRTVATFTGGFKREHGAFKYGEFAQKNYSSHYGFVEDGVVLSQLQPGLATIFALSNGRIEMKTWEDRDNKLLDKIRFARQNGVPLVEFDQSSQTTIPGALVNRWGPGNWSGSEDMKLRTLRSGVAVQKNDGKRFLIYAVFSDATPSAMARIFQAYRCQYAFLLDMNALEHTYLAVYRRSGSQLFIDHLIQGMEQVDKSAAGETAPRFLGHPDNRDFFYVMRRKP